MDCLPPLPSTCWQPLPPDDLHLLQRSTFQLRCERYSGTAPRTVYLPVPALLPLDVFGVDEPAVHLLCGHFCEVLIHALGVGQFAAVIAMQHAPPACM